MTASTIHAANVTEGATPAPTMRVIVNGRFGAPDTLELREVAKPVLADESVLVRVRSASVNPLDWHYMRGEPYFARLMGMGVRRPRTTIRGVDVAGVVEAVGRSVTEFRPGDEVFGFCNGSFAEYACGREKNFVPKPAGLTLEGAAAIPVAGCTALQALRDRGRLQPGQTVLINGAAGGVGTFAVQIAKALGGEVTAVCSTRNLDMVRSIGADHVVDYTREDFTRGGRQYDLIVDTVGNRSFRAFRRVSTPDGTLVLVGAPSGRWLQPFPQLLKVLVLSRFAGPKLARLFANICKPDLLVLRDLAEAGKLTPVIDRTYPLQEVPVAIRYLETGHARGKVAITV